MPASSLTISATRLNNKKELFGRTALFLLVFACPATCGDLHGGTGGQTFGNIQHSLVAAAPENQLQAALCQHEGAVDEHIQPAQQRLLMGFKSFD